jgi:hypothetical protein
MQRLPRFLLANSTSFKFPNSVPELQTWQKGMLLLLIPAVLIICTVIAREIYFAVNPDRRPRKRKRRPERDGRQ